MANDGTITFSVWLDADNAEKELNNIKKKILALQAELATQQNTRNDMAERLHKIAEAAVEAHEKLVEMRETGAAAPAIAEQKKIVSGLDAEFDKANTELQKQDQNIEKINHGLERLQTQYGLTQKAALEAGDAGASAGAKGSAAGDALSSRLDKITSRIAGLMKRVLFFSLFTKLFRSVRDYIGDALKTSDEFTAALSNLKGATMTAFQPLLTAAIPILTAFVNELTRAMYAFADFMSMIFKTTTQESANSAEALNSEAKALDKVGGSAGKAAKQLAAFDEINQLGNSAGGGGRASSDIAATFQIPGEEDLPVWYQKIKKFFEDFNSGKLFDFGFTFGDDLIRGFKEWFKQIADGAGILWEDLKILWQGFSKWWSENAAPWFSGIVSGFATWFKQIADGAGILWEDLKILWQGFSEWWSENAAPWFSGIVSGFATWFKQITDGASTLWEDLKMLWSGFASWWSSNAKPWFTGLVSGFRTWFKQITDGAGILWEDLKTLWSGFATWWDSNAKPWFSGLVVGFRTWFKQIASGAATLWADFKKIWANISDWWKTDVAPKFTKKFWVDKFSTIKEGMREVLNGLITHIENAINFVVRQLNGLSFDIPGVFGSAPTHVGFEIPMAKIPRLAAGAVIPPNQQFLAVLGDQSSGTNIETPLDTMVAAFRQALNESGAGQRQLVLQIGQREFATLVFDAFRNESGRVGTAMVR